MKSYTTILSPAFDAMRSTLVARAPLARVIHVKTNIEQKTTATLNVARTYWIELVSILMICLLLYVAFHYFRSSSSRTRESSNEKNLTATTENLLQQQGLTNGGAGHLTGYTEIEQSFVTNIGDEPPPVLEIRQFTKDWESLFLPEDTRLTVEGKIIVENEVPEKKAAGPREPRRSGRARKATKRFEESWCNENFPKLGSALGVKT